MKVRDGDGWDIWTRVFAEAEIDQLFEICRPHESGPLKQRNG